MHKIYHEKTRRLQVTTSDEKYWAQRRREAIYLKDVSDLPIKKGKLENIISSNVRIYVN